MDELVGLDPGVVFQVVDVLGEVGQELVLVLEELDEGVGGGELFAGGQDVFGDGVEDAGVLAEEADVEDFLRVAEAEVLELGVEAGFFGAEVGDAETG